MDHACSTKEIDAVQARVAIVTRTKNRPALLPRALASVGGQTYRDLLWVIVNDGGQRAPVEEIAAQARSAGVPTLVVHNEFSLGMEAASNAGIAESHSEFLIIHDDDDTWSPAFLEKTVSFLDGNPGYGGVITHTTRIDEKIVEDRFGTTVKEVGRTSYNSWLLSVHLSEMAEMNPFPPIAFLYRRSVLEAIGPYDISLAVLGDWEFNLRFLAKYDIGVIPEPLANYHWRPSVGGAYGNSVGAGIDKHVQWDAIVRNRLLRKDLEAGTVGLGHLVAAGRRQVSLNRMLYPLSVARGAAKRLVLGLRRVAGAA
ncbi:glycosyltransferase family 2 protein [Methylorubrum extorquens]|uniref:glycosyltransferase family 2 protein n=1 Tax=Methylorubrum extorquens TaxID=408 RepID=UPI000C1FC20D|nr:glycosyltransferase family A protein [Methylorubrum extorquens]